MWRRGPDDRALEVKELGSRAGWGLLLLVGVGLLLVGCTRSSGPTPREVHKPIMPSSSEMPTEMERPPVIEYPDIPEVPEAVRNPSPPIETE